MRLLVAEPSISGLGHWTGSGRTKTNVSWRKATSVRDRRAADNEIGRRDNERASGRPCFQGRKCRPFLRCAQQSSQLCHRESRLGDSVGSLRPAAAMTHAAGWDPCATGEERSLPSSRLRFAVWNFRCGETLSGEGTYCDADQGFHVHLEIVRSGKVDAGLRGRRSRASDACVSAACTLLRRRFLHDLG